MNFPPWCDASTTTDTPSARTPTTIRRACTKLPIEKVRAEIDQGISDIGAALWDPKDLAPFFRIPGLNRSDAIEEELAARSLIVFSSDTVADDWHRRIKPADIVNRAMSRLEARGRGILLLHDIHAATVAALPELLKKLKEAGFHVVHVVPATADTMYIAGVPPVEIADDPPREIASESGARDRQAIRRARLPSMQGTRLPVTRRARLPPTRRTTSSPTGRVRSPAIPARNRHWPGA